MSNPRIFISYKRADRDKVFRIKERIETETGEECWIDLDGIESDAQFKNVIINAINNCEIVLFMYSKTHGNITDFEKDWTVRELNFASSKGKRIVFVNIDGSPLTDAFAFDYSTKQQIDARSDEAMSRLTSDIIRWFNLPAMPSGNSEKDGASNNKTSVSSHGKFQPGKTGMVIMWTITGLSLIYTIMANILATNKLDDLTACLSLLPVVIIIVGLANPSLLLLKQRKTVLWYLLSNIIILMGFGNFPEELDPSQKELNTLKQQTTFKGDSVNWSADATKEQVLAVGEIFESMEPIEGGMFMQGAEPLANGKYDEKVEQEFETPAFRINVQSFHIGKFEITIGQWNSIMGDNRKGDPKLPIASITFDQAKQFTEKLSKLTGLKFRLPTESEWEYAAKGGDKPEGFSFAGSENPDEVAWYSANSDGVAHSNLKRTPTVNDLFNMSGNVSEWCDTPFKPYGEDVPYNDKTMVVRGGNFDSEPYEITVTHRMPASPDTSIPTLGFRIALDKSY